ncbi:MAG TPA: hypothetical protein VKH45_04015 [Candidatus Acidoferrum sp.]|nr:hypothetical protein [Candidatus Acidoferrum sp.]
MRRILSNPITALLVGACLRLLFVFKFPASAGDTAIYEQLAANWLKYGKYAMDIGGQPVPVDLRMPGYPAFLVIVYALSGRTGETARLFVMAAQILVDLATSLIIALLAGALVLWCGDHAKPKSAFTAGLWLAVLCPLTANYVAVPLTEVWAVLFTSACFLSLVVLAMWVTTGHVPGAISGNPFTRNFWTLAVFAGFTAGLGTLFRPETPLILVTSSLLLGYWMWRRGELQRWLLACFLMVCAGALPLVPWAIRNAITFHEFQALAPKNTTLPGEVDPQGFMSWERTWLYRVRDCYLVPWKLNEEAINLEDIPDAAFDTPEEKERVATILETYNDDLMLTAEQDRVFAQLARERTARYPFRTYLWIPLLRAGRIWFTPRIELIPVSGHVFPLAYMSEEDPVDQRVTILYFSLNLFYVMVAVLGIARLWKCRAARPAIWLLVVYILVRTAFLTTLEAPEPRYTLECFPALLALGAQLFVARPNPKAVVGLEIGCGSS